VRGCFVSNAREHEERQRLTHEDLSSRVGAEGAGQSDYGGIRCGGEGAFQDAGNTKRTRVTLNNLFDREHDALRYGDEMVA
jgi:hypothetical protein